MEWIILFQVSFHFETYFLNPDEVMQERFKIHPLWNEIWEAQFSNLLKPHRLADQTNSDQSNQSPRQKVSNQPTCKKVSQDNTIE